MNQTIGLHYHTFIYSNMMLFNDSKYMYHISINSLSNLPIPSQDWQQFQWVYALELIYTILLFKSQT